MNDPEGFIMEDTFLPLRLSAFPAEVPLLANIEYDFGGLKSFPNRHGVTSADLSDLDHRPVENSASLLQSWLFFGLLADLTGTLVDRQSVLHLKIHQNRSDPEILDHPATLQHPKLGFWIASSSEESDSRTVSRNLRRVVRVGIENVKRIDRLDVASRHPMPLVLLSIKILLCDLAAMRVRRQAIYPLPWDEQLDKSGLVPFPSDFSSLSSSAQSLQAMMIAKGWCPSQTERAGSTYDYSMMHYLSTIDRKNSEKTSHELCSLKLCKAYNSEPDNYVTAHTVLGCQCNFIAAPTQQLDEIIRSGGVPLVSLAETSHSKLAIRVHKSNAKSCYTAISHVWSGGLGNIQANALPLCQLRYLDNCLSKLPNDGERGFNYKKNPYIRDPTGKVWISSLGLDNLEHPKNRRSKLFWIDTLCIPVDPKSSDLRMKAINKMDAVYAHAREVLVLDSEVQSFSISATHPCELLVRIAYSSWMGRSWTLQEGAIGQATYFQCADGALTLERPRSYSVQQSPLSLMKLGFRGARSTVKYRCTKINYSESVISHNVGHARVENFLLKTILNSLRRGRKGSTMADMNMIGLVPEDVQLDSFVSVWNELIRRTTTKAEDMFAIFANLLDFNAGQIIKLPPDERMKVILWSSSVIPLSLLFNTGPRYKDSQSHRDRWVPTVPKGSELTKSPSMRFAKDGHSFYLTATGDEDQPIAMIARFDSLPRYCYLQDAQSGKVYFVRSVRSVEDTTVTIPHQAMCIIMEPLPSMERAKTEKHSLTVGVKKRRACLFVTSEKSSSTSTPEGQERLSIQPSQARKSETTVLSTVYDCPVRIWEVDNVNCIPQFEMVMLESRDSMVECPILECTTLKPDYDLYLETGI